MNDLDLRIKQLDHKLNVVRRAVRTPGGWTASIEDGPHVPVEVEVDDDGVIFVADFGPSDGSRLLLFHDDVLLSVQPITPPGGIEFEARWSFAIGSPERV